MYAKFQGKWLLTYFFPQKYSALAPLQVLVFQSWKEVISLHTHLANSYWIPASALWDVNRDKKISVFIELTIVGGNKQKAIKKTIYNSND